MDADYTDQLSEKDKAWLAKFQDEFYAKRFRGKPLHAKVAQRREVYRALNAAERDTFTEPSEDGRSVDGPDETERDNSPIPAYLNSPSYKAERDAIRAAIPEDRRKGKREAAPAEEDVFHNKVEQSLQAAKAMQRKKK